MRLPRELGCGSLFFFAEDRECPRRQQHIPDNWVQGCDHAATSERRTVGLSWRRLQAALRFTNRPLATPCLEGYECFTHGCKVEPEDLRWDEEGPPNFTDGSALRGVRPGLAVASIGGLPGSWEKREAPAHPYEDAV